MAGKSKKKSANGKWERARTVLEMEGVHAAYHGDISILNGLSIAVKENCITGVIGPNGAGKSTALKTMYGFLHPTQGSISLEGRDISGLPPYEMMAHGIAFVPQNRSLFNDLSVEDNLRLGCWQLPIADKRQGRNRSWRRSMPSSRSWRRSSGDLAGSLSGGQQRFVELGRALVVEPKIIMLDEPTAMIAPKISREIYDFIETLPERGITVVLVGPECASVRQCLRLYLYPRPGPKPRRGDGSHLRAR